MNLDNRYHDNQKKTSINIYVGFKTLFNSKITTSHRLFISTWYMHIVQEDFVNN